MKILLSANKVLIILFLGIVVINNAVAETKLEEFTLAPGQQREFTVPNEAQVIKASLGELTPKGSDRTFEIRQSGGLGASCKGGCNSVFTMFCPKHGTSGSVTNNQIVDVKVTISSIHCDGSKSMPFECLGQNSEAFCKR